MLGVQWQTLPHSQRIHHRLVDLTGDVQAVLALVSSKSVSRRWSKAAIDGAAIISLPGQRRLHPADLGIRARIVITGLGRFLCVFVRNVAVAVVAAVIIGPVRVTVAVGIAVAIAIGIKSGGKNYPRVVDPAAAVPAPVVIAVPVPVAVPVAAATSYDAARVVIERSISKT